MNDSSADTDTGVSSIISSHAKQTDAFWDHLVRDHGNQQQQDALVHASTGTHHVADHKQTVHYPIQYHILKTLTIPYKGLLPKSIYQKRKPNGKFACYPVGNPRDFDIRIGDIVVEVNTDPIERDRLNNHIISTPLCATPNGLTGRENFRTAGLATKESSILDNLSEDISFAAMGLGTVQTIEEPVKQNQTLYVDWPSYRVIDGVRIPAFLVRNRTTETQFTWVVRPFEWASCFALFNAIAIDASQNRMNSDRLWAKYGRWSMCRHMEAKEESSHMVNPLLGWIMYVCALASASGDSLLPADAKPGTEFLKEETVAQFTPQLQKEAPGLFVKDTYVDFNVAEQIPKNAKSGTKATYTSLTLGPLLLARYAQQFEKRILGKALKDAEVGGTVDIALAIRPT